jgi:hypothetical protein
LLTTLVSFKQKKQATVTITAGINAKYSDNHNNEYNTMSVPSTTTIEAAVPSTYVATLVGPVPTPPPSSYHESILDAFYYSKPTTTEWSKPRNPT